MHPNFYPILQILLCYFMLFEPKNKQGRNSREFGIINRYNKYMRPLALGLESTNYFPLKKMAIVPRKMQSRANRHIFSASDGITMTKHILATHAPVDGHIDIRPLLNVVEDIFLCAASLIPGNAQVCV